MKKLCIVLGLLCSLISSCSPNYRKPDKSPIDFDSVYMNHQIRLIAMKELSPFKTNDFEALLLEYDTTNEIVFPSNFNLRLFIQQDGEWVEIREKPTIRVEDPVILSPKIPSSHGQLVGFWPQLDDLTKTYFMRVYIFGDMKTPEGTKKVAAFADFILTP